MSVNARISVITGAYNVGKCFSFKKSINSVLQQTFADFEFIICDDGSTDNTWNLLCEFAEKDNRIKLLRNEKNLGLAASLNYCFEKSTGEFIARHDCDDISAPQRFEKQVTFLETHKDIAVLGCNVYLFDENGIWGKEDFPENVKDSDFLFTSPYKHGSVIFRRETLIKTNGYRVAKETYRTEDYDLFMMFQTFCMGANLQERLYYFCENHAAEKRRKYRYRVDEARVRYKGFKRLGLFPKGIPYVIKPLVVGLIPFKLLNILKDKYYGRR